MNTLASTTQNSGTLQDLIASRCREKADADLSTREFYGAGLQILRSNRLGFSVDACDLFPKLHGHTPPEIDAWWWMFCIWYVSVLDSREQALFSKSQVICQ